MSERPTAFVILAAGAGRRMGGVAKSLIRINGETILRRTMQAAQSVSLCDSFLVTGCHNAVIQAEMDTWANVAPYLQKPQLIHLDEPGDDPSVSLNAALRGLGASTQYETVFIALADLPLLNSSDFEKALEAFKARPRSCRMLVPVHDGNPGHPVVMEVSLARELLTKADMSLRHWRQSHPEQVTLWPMGNDHCVRDLDTTDDLDRLGEETGWDCQLPQVS